VSDHNERPDMLNVACLTRNVEVVGSSPIKGPWARNFTLIA